MPTMNIVHKLEVRLYLCHIATEGDLWYFVNLLMNCFKQKNREKIRKKFSGKRIANYFSKKFRFIPKINHHQLIETISLHLLL